MGSKMRNQDRSDTKEIHEGRCIGCGSTKTSFFFKGPDRLQEKSADYSLYRCDKCDTKFLFPTPKNNLFPELYPDDYLPHKSQKSNHPDWLNQKGVMKQIRTVNRASLRKGRAIDVGFGSGIFLAALQRDGWVATGIEPKHQTSLKVKMEYGISTITGDIHYPPFPPSSFDLITFWDVLEHLAHPVLTIRNAYKLSKPLGTLIISVPNPASLEAKIFKKYWAGWDIPRHNWIFTLDVLKKILQENNWEVTKISYFRGRYWLLAQSIRFLLQERNFPKILIIISTWFIQSLAGRMLFFPIFIVLEKFRLSSIVVLTAKRL